MDVMACGADPGGLDNAAAFTRAAKTGVVDIPAGDFEFRSPIVRDGGPLTIRGAGKAQTRLFWRGSTDGIRHQQNHVAYEGDLRINGVSLIASDFVDGAAIRATMHRDRGNVSLEDVDIKATLWEHNWNRHIVLRGATNTEMRNVWTFGGYSLDRALRDRLCQVSLELQSQSGGDGSYVYRFDGCAFNAITHAVHVNITGPREDRGTLEGVIFENCGGSTATGPWLRLQNSSGDPGWAPPYYVLVRCNMEGHGSLIDVDCVSEFHMTGCLMYSKATLPDGPTLNYINLGNGRPSFGVYIHHNTFGLYDGARVASYIGLKGGSERAEISNNTFFRGGNTRIGGAGIWVEGPSPGLIVRDNRYLNWGDATREVIPGGADHYVGGEVGMRLTDKPWGGDTALTLLANPDGTPTLMRVKVGPKNSAGQGRRALYIDN